MKTQAIYISHMHSCRRAAQLVNELRALDGEKILFYNDVVGVPNDGFAIMHAKNMYYYEGPVMATCAMTALYLEKCPTPCRKLWMFNGDLRSQPKPAKDVLRLLGSLEIVTMESVYERWSKHIAHPVLTINLREVFDGSAEPALV